MSYEVRLTPETKADLRSIFEYIAYNLQSVQNAVVSLTVWNKESTLWIKCRKDSVNTKKNRGAAAIFALCL